MTKQSEDKTEKIYVLQSYIKEYMQFIESTSYIKGLRKCHINFDEKTNNDIDEQLTIMEGIVLLHETLHSATNYTFKMCLKKLMKQSGIFTETQLDAIETAMDMSKRDRWIRKL